ncbi:MAG: toll/interleukin receptor protein [Planctomycetaceae bacterium]|nr:toll/interleukin receptor protein [Planctomycetaceae bacterium]
MALISIAEIDANEQRAYGGRLRTKTASEILQEDTVKYPLTFQFDIFLSHSYSDVQISRDRLLGLKAILEDLNYTVYVDWLIDTTLDRERVTDSTAMVLRTRMSHSRSLLFATSANSQNSKWMPWELGFKDGQSAVGGSLGTVAILPLATYSGSHGFEGQEYLGVYPYIDKSNNKGGIPKLWVHEDEETYVQFDDWLSGKKPFKRT